MKCLVEVGTCQSLENLKTVRNLSVRTEVSLNVIAFSMSVVVLASCLSTLRSCGGTLMPTAHMPFRPYSAAHKSVGLEAR